MKSILSLISNGKSIIVKVNESKSNTRVKSKIISGSIK